MGKILLTKQNKPENQQIIELSKFTSPNKDKILALMEESLDYPYMLGHILFNRMGAVAYYTLKTCELLGKVNREFRTTLKSIYDVGVDKSNSFSAAIEMLGNILRNVGFPYALLKGAYFNQRYPVGLRTSNDIDILIEQKNITSISDLLLANGFGQGHIRNGNFTPASRMEIIYSRMNQGETVPFIKRIDLPKMEYLEIDLNFSLDYKAIQTNDNVENMLKRAKPLINGNIYTLSEYDFLIHLCVHLYKEGIIKKVVDMNRDMSIYKFCDIYFLLNDRTNQQFYKHLTERVNELELDKECYYAIFYTRELFDMENDGINMFLSAIKPEDTKYLKQVISPSDNKVYEFDEDITKWVFCSNRKERLRELK